MSKLVIVESAAKAKTINKYLGKEYKVRASLGHVRDLPKSKMGVDIEHDFTPDYVIIADRKKIITELKKLAKDSDEVFLATDLDREGEAIAWHLASVLKLPSQKTRRVVFNEITSSAIREAFQNPAAVDENKVNAQQARRILDRIVGYQLSPLLWQKVRRGLSAGRVQSVAVRLIVEREREIEKFKPQEYWEIAADLAPLKPHAGEPGKFRAELTKLDGKPIVTAAKDEGGEERSAFALGNEAQAKQLADELRGARFVVTRCDRKERSMAAPPPFNTSTLQQQASIQLHFSTRKTMLLAQRLYEGVELGPRAPPASSPTCEPIPCTWPNRPSASAAISSPSSSRRIIFPRRRCSTNRPRPPRARTRRFGRPPPSAHPNRSSRSSSPTSSASTI